MQLGVFAKTFPRKTFAESLDAAAAHGLNVIHFNFSCVGLATLPEKVEPALIDSIRREATSRGVSIVGVSGTFNIIDADVNACRANIARFSVLAAATRSIGCQLITLCTGTCDQQDMWRAHPDNASSAAWIEMRRSMEQLVAIAEQHDVLLGVEPEVGNVVSGVRKARQLLDELQSRRVKIVLDPANLFPHGDVSRVRDRIEEAFQLLGTDIVMAHAKELAPDGSVGTLPPGRGVLDWNYYLDTLSRMDFSGALVMHGLAEKDVAEATRFLRSKFCD